MSGPDADPPLPREEDPLARQIRRAHLAILPNPAPRVEPPLDYLVALDGRLRQSGPKVRLVYVPGKLVLETQSFGRYLAEVDPEGRRSPEAVAHMILEDINNEVVPRFLQIRVTGAGPQEDGPVHRVLVEDREPKWSNPALLAGIPSI